MPDPDSVNCSHPNPHFLLQFVLLLVPDWVPLVYRVPGTPGVYYITVHQDELPVAGTVPGYTKVRRPGIINRECEQSVTPPDKELE